MVRNKTKRKINYDMIKISEPQWISEVLKNRKILKNNEKVQTNKNGVPHSNNKDPAVISPLQTKMWFNKGLYHREDGPAIEYYDGYSEYWLKGKFYTKEQWEKEVLKLRLKRLSEL